jgi:hypothetical protein
MRFLTWAVACTLGGALGVATADEPAKAPAPSTATAAASSDTAIPPGAVSAGASTPAVKPELTEDQLEKHFRAEGYKVQVRGGEKWYCKPIIETGTRLASSQPVCVPGQQLLIKERQQQEDLEKAQRVMGHPNGG